ncbi:MAG: response regulator [Bacteroidetes bacterium]|nr:response regulator [Bacteroidota bacterium]
MQDVTAPAKVLTRVLLIEDNPADARLVEIFLRESTLLDCQITRADELQSGLEKLEEGEFDVILLDLTLPDSQGFSTVKTMIEEFPEYTIIVMTGLEDENLALNSVKAGAQDFIVKGKFDANLLSRTISYAIERHSLTKRIEDYARTIKENERRLIEAQNMARIGNWELDIITSKMFWSEEVFRILGYGEKRIEPTLNAYLADVLSEDADHVRSEINRSMEKGAQFQLEYRLKMADGSIKTVANQGQIKMSQKSGSIVLVGTIQDISSLRGQSPTGMSPAFKSTADTLAEKLRRTGLKADQEKVLDQLQGLWNR